MILSFWAGETAQQVLDVEPEFPSPASPLGPIKGTSEIKTLCWRLLVGLSFLFVCLFVYPSFSYFSTPVWLPGPSHPTTQVLLASSIFCGFYSSLSLSLSVRRPQTPRTLPVPWQCHHPLGSCELCSSSQLFLSLLLSAGCPGVSTHSDSTHLQHPHCGSSILYFQHRPLP